MIALKSMEELFTILNGHVQYAVLRNYEHLLLPGDALLAGHPDIDLICTDREQILSLNITSSRGSSSDRVHRSVLINQQPVDLDLREVGDGYYCRKWEEDMISRRKLYLDSFYVLDHEDHFFSLLYHVLVQKKTVSDDYKARLIEMGSTYGLTQWDDGRAWELLNRFLREHGYTYSYPESARTVFNRKNAAPDLMEKDIRKQAVRSIEALKAGASKLLKK